MIEPDTKIGAVTLKVQNLDLMQVFYRDVVGLHLRQASNALVELGTPASTLVRLLSQPGGQFVPRTTGLYHMALRVPSRADLGGWLRHYAGLGAPHWQGGSDHGVSEALYLADLEGNGIELYHDQPRSQWTIDESGQIGAFLNRLDLDALVQEAPAGPWDKLPAATDMGHIHLKVNDMAQARRFYADLCGFGIKTVHQDSALFVAAGDYHHHIGLNTWQSLDAQTLPENAYGLAEVEILLNGPQARDKLEARLRRADYPHKVAHDDLLIIDPAGIAHRFRWNPTANQPDPQLSIQDF